MPLLDGDGWQGRIYSGGWTEGSGEPYPVVSPVDRRDARPDGAGDRRPTCSQAAAAAADAQRAWAARRTPSGPRCCAGPATCGTRNAEEITGWLMRETGAIGPFGGFQVMTSARGVLRGGGPRLRAVRRAAALLAARG